MTINCCVVSYLFSEHLSFFRELLLRYISNIENSSADFIQRSCSLLAFPSFRVLEAIFYGIISIF